MTKPEVHEATETSARPVSSEATAPGAVASAPSATYERILAAAQKHFVEHGLQHASVRAITSLAKANPASVVYYFGSKEELFEVVLNRCVQALVTPRLKALDLAEQQAAGAPVPLALLMRILAEPYVLGRADAHRPAAVYARFYGRMYAEPNDVHRRVVRTGFEDLQQRFLAALRLNLPALPVEELTWRFVAVLSALVHVAANTGVADRISAGASRLSDPQLLEVLSHAFVAMLAAPSALPAGTIN